MRRERLIDAGKAMPAEADAAHVLKLLVVDYERERFGESGQPDDSLVDRLRYLMEENGMTASDLGRLLGDRPLGIRILSSERELSKAHVHKLAKHFKLNLGYFI
jgi:antitoxin component HigA of HigAB toxin-antitoxin module